MNFAVAHCLLILLILQSLKQLLVYRSFLCGTFTCCTVRCKKLLSVCLLCIGWGSSICIGNVLIHGRDSWQAHSRGERYHRKMKTDGMNMQRLPLTGVKGKKNLFQPHSSSKVHEPKKERTKK